MASTLNSSSTFEDIEASYIDNASYAEDASVTKAKAFITACRILLLKLPAEGQQSNRFRGRFDENLKQISNEMDEAKAWLSANDTTRQPGKVIHADFSNFRD